MRRAIGSAIAGAAILAATGCGADQHDEPVESGQQGAAPGGGTATDVLSTAQQRLGDAYAGGYLGEGGQPVVLTTEATTTDTIRSLGARAEVVEFSTAALSDWQGRIDAALRPQPPRAVTSWGVDVRRNAVVVDVLVGEPVPPQLQQIVDDSAGAVVLDEAQEPVRPLPRG
ncbi:MAG: hypothetical protein GEV09_19520 [Pseudonocardiaceae bacterium]|nr:hypothetical protein [Pseudonocardiaceae bacterium]